MKQHKKTRLIFLSIICSHLFFSSVAQIRLPQLVSNHMVLQRGVKLKIWGWATPGEQVNVSFNGKKARSITGVGGKWMIALPEMKAGGPYQMDIKGKNQITLTDIMIGDVWFCSGQSNMVLPMERLKYKYAEEISKDNFPEIRNFFVPTKADVSVEYEDLPQGKWTAATGKGILEFGGLSYFFAKELYQKYHVPIGIINASVGGTPIEAWMSKEAYSEFPAYSARINNFRDSSFINRLNRSIEVYNRAHPSEQNVLVDKGVTGPLKWTDTAYIPENWHRFFLPGYWVDQGVKPLTGILYFRKEIILPSEMTGVAARLVMGTITNSDSTFVNGKFVGNTTYQYPPRNYTIPAGLLKTGKNIIIVKVTSTVAKGGFVPDKQYLIEAGGKQFDLRGDWTYRVGMVQEKENAMSRVIEDAKSPRPIIAQSSPTGLYNTMVAPVINYSIKGILWYQGETNAGKAAEYSKFLPALITDWRKKWGQPALPFLYPQLPNFMEVDYSPEESNWAELRQSQLSTLSVPNTGMAVTIDLGEWNDIHPLDKKTVGERLALWAEHLAYNEKSIVYSGPLYESATKQGNKVALKFTSIGSGLKTIDGAALSYFAIAGTDKKYRWAKAKIEGSGVVVWNDKISNPVYVRYAWSDNPQGANLSNNEGLPASPFEAVVK